MGDSMGVTGIGASLGLAARFAAVFLPQLYEFIGERVEFSGPTNSWKRTSEGIFLYDAGVDPYSGDMYHETPLCLVVLWNLKNMCPVLLDLLFPICDLLSAVLLYLFARNVLEQKVVSERKDKAEYSKESWSLMVDFDAARAVPRSVLLWFLCNPLLLGSCWARSSGTFTCLFLAASFFCASNGRTVVHRCLSLLFLAFATYQTLYMFLLFPPLHLYIQQVARQESKEERKFFPVGLFSDVAVFCGFLGGLLLMSSHIMGSWSFVRGVYGFLISAPDLTPNVGLYWYFFTEMFEQFRSFFTWIFFLNICIYSLPVSVKLKKDPAFALLVLVALITVFKPYPSYGDIGFYLSLFPIWKHLIPQMRQTLVVSVMLIVSGVVFPVLWKLWLEQGSANANFIYAITLVLAAAQVFFVTDVIIAHEKRDWFLKHGKEHVDENGNKLELHLQ